MRWFVAAFVVVSLAGVEARALAWSGVSVGTSTKKDVQKLHGRPVAESSGCLAYENPKIFPGTSQVKFCFNDKDQLEKIDVFPSIELDLQHLTLMFGTAYLKKTLRTGQVVILYRDAGLVIFLEEDQEHIMSLRYQAVRGDEAEPPPAAK